jgi:hypothetical protein
MNSFVSFVVGLSFLSVAACAVSSEQEDAPEQSESRVVTHMARPPEGDERVVERETLPEQNGAEHVIVHEVRPDSSAMRAEDEAPLSPPEAKRVARPFSRTSGVH